MNQGDIERHISEGSRLHQAEHEPYDFFAMRAFIIAMERVSYGQAKAMFHWMVARGSEDLEKMLKQRDAAHSQTSTKGE